MSNGVSIISMTALGLVTLTAALLSALTIVLFWVRRPRLGLRWRLALFVGIAVLPTLAAGTSTVDGLNRTSERQFCGSCHVMEAHYKDAIDPKSTSLASRHTRNHLFGESSCYKCHANYGMFGYPLTKLNGMRHVWHYYFGKYGRMSLEEALPVLHLYQPYPNENCLHCHAGTNQLWQAVDDHRAVADDARSGKVSCASAGCHGDVHPASVAARAAKKAREGENQGKQEKSP